MKKFLSLVLALVMTMSLVTISAGAKDFTDDASITYEEAVAVVSAAGIIDGYTDGSFRPTATLTRGAAAKIICNLILGTTTAGALVANDAPYKDVPVDHTFAGYIAYCANEGIISGYADGTFKPAAPLTGYAFLKMLLGALGYDAQTEGYVGTNWSIQVAKQALAIELEDGNDDFNGTQAVTREEAALYAFNTLKATMVEYTDKTEVTTGDTTVTITGRCYDVSNGAKKETIVDDNAMQFAEKYFDDLEMKEGKANGMGFPATQWDWDGEEIGTYGKKADEIYVLNKSNQSIYTVLVDSADFMELDEDDFASKVTATINGDEEYDEVAISDMTAKDLMAGDTIYVFEDDDNEFYKVCVVRMTAAEIDDVDDDLSSSEIRKGSTIGIDLKEVNNAIDVPSQTLYDSHKEGKYELKGFDADTYEEEAIIAIAYRAGTDGVLASYIPESVTGTVSAYKSGDKATITVDGTKYPVSGALAAVSNNWDYDFDDSDYTIYLDENGYVIWIDGKTEADLEDVYYVTYAAKDENKYGTATYYAQAIDLNDGSVTEFELTDDAIDAIEDEVGTLVDSKEVKLLASFDEDDGEYDIEWYYGDDDFEISIETMNIDLAKSDKNMKVDGKKVYFEDETIFVKVEDEAGKDIDVKTTTGSVSAKVNGATVIAIWSESDKTKTAAFVIIDSSAEIKNSQEADEVIYIKDNTETSNADGYEVTAYFMNGTGASETITYEAPKQATKGTFWTFSIDDDGIYDLDNDAVELKTEVKDGKYDDETGYAKNAVLTGLYKGALTATADGVVIDDVDLGENVIVLDHRNADTRSACYNKVVDSVGALETLMAKDGYNVTANLFLDDEEVVLVAIWSITE